MSEAADIDTVVGSAKLMAEGLPRFRENASAYRLDPPLPWTDYRTNEHRLRKATYVIVTSSTDPDLGTETVVFPAKKVGHEYRVAAWTELPGSFIGGNDHQAALVIAGYVVTL